MLDERAHNFYFRDFYESETRLINPLLLYAIVFLRCIKAILSVWAASKLPQCSKYNKISPLLAIAVCRSRRLYAICSVYRSGGKLPGRGLTAPVSENGTQLRCATGAAADRLVRKHPLQQLQGAGQFQYWHIPGLAQLLAGQIELFTTIGMKQSIGPYHMGAFIRHVIKQATDETLR